MKKKKLIVLIAAALLVLCLLAFDVRLKTVKYQIDAPEVEEKITFALVADLHSCYYGKEQSRLIKAIERQNPDIVLLGGDIFDDHMSYDNAETFVSAIASRYPCYYVTGNHEYWSWDVEYMLDFIRSCGVTVLAGDCEVVEINGQRINLCGVDDPDADVYGMSAPYFSRQLDIAADEAQDGLYTVLLAHRPERIEQYLEHDFDLVLSGHAHGGQWRLPGIINGVFAPNQGLFPRYAGGRYDFDETTMIVSRGLARESTLVPRLFNRPELVIIELI